MATASGCGACAPIAGFPALNGLAAHAKKLTSLCSVQTVFASMKRGVASDAGPQDHSPRAPVLYAHRDPAMHGVAGRPSGAAGNARCCGKAVECRGDARSRDGRRAVGIHSSITLDGEAKLCVGGLWRE